jgi:hypothetical protein
VLSGNRNTTKLSSSPRPVNPIRKQTVATTTGSARELPEELALPAPGSMWVELPVMECL